MSVPPYDPPPPRERPVITPLVVGLVLGAIALVVLCCLGVAALSVFVPPPPG